MEEGRDKMDKLLFLVIFFTVVIYLTIHIVSFYKILKVDLVDNHLRTDKLSDANYWFKISLFSIGVFFLVFLNFYIPQNFSSYIDVSIYMLIYFVGIFIMYSLSTKSAKELFYMNILVTIVNIRMFSLPILMLLLANGV